MPCPKATVSVGECEKVLGAADNRPLSRDQGNASQRRELFVYVTLRSPGWANHAIAGPLHRAV
jgi:hypothetical protein